MYKLSIPKEAGKIKTIKELYEKFPDLAEIMGDVTEQQINRPKKNSKQKKHYSGKKKKHTLKTQVFVNKKKKFLDVSKSYPGHIYDKTILEQEQTPSKIPRFSKIYLDNAYHKIQQVFPNKIFILPEKANRWHKIKPKQKKENVRKSKKIIVVENSIAKIKRFKILSYRYHHDTVKYNRTFKNICVIENFQLDLTTA